MSGNEIAGAPAGSDIMPVLHPTGGNGIVRAPAGSDIMLVLHSTGGEVDGVVYRQVAVATPPQTIDRQNWGPQDFDVDGFLAHPVAETEAGNYLLVVASSIVSGGKLSVALVVDGKVLYLRTVSGHDTNRIALVLS